MYSHHQPLHWLHLFNCSLHKSNQPIKWQELNALRHVDKVKLILKLISSNQASEGGRNVIYMFERIIQADSQAYFFKGLKEPF